MDLFDFLSSHGMDSIEICAFVVLFQRLQGLKRIVSNGLTDSVKDTRESVARLEGRFVTMHELLTHIRTPYGDATFGKE